ncbi:MAG TPA: MarR family transcriptional regulator [Protaetiibacter sp.]|nr:MarR family transcriptional regulator [Protaetiibacter sp.]
MSDAREAALLRASRLTEETNFLAVKTAVRGSKLANDALGAYGLRVRSYSVLALAVCEVAVTQRDLAAALSLDPSQVVSLVDDLEASGLVRRVVDPSDRRSRVIQATSAGRDSYLRARVATAEAEARQLEALTPLERETLRDLLARVVVAGA